MMANFPFNDGQSNEFIRSITILWRVTSPDTKPIALPQHFKLKPQEFMRQWSIFAKINDITRQFYSV